MTQPANPVTQPALGKTLDPIPVPPSQRGTEAPVAGTHEVHDASDIGGRQVRP
jgi:hypothetical protein